MKTPAQGAQQVPAATALAGRVATGERGATQRGAPPPVTRDAIVDGVDLNGADGQGGNLLWYFAGTVERAAIVNVRGHGVGPGSLQHGTDIVVAGCNLMTGARPREVNGYPEGWGIRGGERMVVFDNRIDGTRYHRVRVHPGPGVSPLVWIAHNTFVDPFEARIASAFDLQGGAGKVAGFWGVCNTVYAYSTCITPSFEGEDSIYGQVTHNTMFGSLTAELHQLLETQQGPGHDYHTGNTYAAWQDPPAWSAPGDPVAAIPLPPVDPTKFDASLMFGPCPGP